MSITVNDRPPNFRSSDGRFFLVRCFACGPSPRGRENQATSVYSGACAWCGWTAVQPDCNDDKNQRPA